MTIRSRILDTLIPRQIPPTEFQEAFETHIDQTPGWLSEAEAWLLWSCARNVAGDRAIVEVGSYLGRSTVALALGSPSASVVAVDPHTGDITEVEQGLTVDTWQGFHSNLVSAHVENRVVAVRNVSVAAAADYSGPPIALLFLDGWHSTDAIKEDVRSWMPHCSHPVTVIVDDWNQAQITKGLIQVIDLLPPVVCAIGKDLVFSSAPDLRSLDVIKSALRRQMIKGYGARMRIMQDPLSVFKRKA